MNNTTRPTLSAESRATIETYAQDTGAFRVNNGGAARLAAALTEALALIDALQASANEDTAAR